jgi:hypothetical protein
MRQDLAGAARSSFRVTVITAYLADGGALEHAQEMAVHESPRTTKLYDRTKERLTKTRWKGLGGDLGFGGGRAVANHADTTITLTDAPDDDKRAVIMDGLRAYNDAQAGVSDGGALAILVSRS